MAKEIEYEENEQLKMVAKRIIEKYPTRFREFNADQILFLDAINKKPNKYADTKKVNPPYTYITSTKFIITFYPQNMEDMSDAQEHALVLHELLHIDDTFTKLVKHDLEDFRMVIDNLGTAWDIDPNVKDILGSGDGTVELDI